MIEQCDNAAKFFTTETAWHNASLVQQQIINPKAGYY